MTPIHICNVDDEAAWKRHRMSGIGASESAAACGLSKYTQPIKLYLRKRGELPDEDENYHMLFGKIMEPAIAELYRRTEGVEVVHAPGLYRHPVYKFMLASPDAYLPELECGLEIKTMEYSVFKQVKDLGAAEAIPDYLVQVQHQIAVMGWERNRLVALVGKRLEPIGEFYRDENAIKTIIQRCGEMWERIITGNPPPIDYSHQSALELVRAMHPGIQSGAVKLGSVFGELQKEYEAASKQMGELKKRQEQIRAIQLQAIGDNEGGLLPDGRLLRRKPIRSEVAAHVKEYTDVRVVKFDDSISIIREVESYEH